MINKDHPLFELTDLKLSLLSINCQQWRAAVQISYNYQSSYLRGFSITVFILLHAVADFETLSCAETVSIQARCSIQKSAECNDDYSGGIWFGSTGNLEKFCTGSCISCLRGFGSSFLEWYWGYGCKCKRF